MSDPTRPDPTRPDPARPCSELAQRLAESNQRSQPSQPSQPSDRTELSEDLRKHLDACPECQAQWTIDGLLREAFAESTVPTLSQDFERRLEARIAKRAATSRLRHLPLRGWRLAALGAYAALAAAALAWLFRDVSWPRLDPSSPALAVATLAAVPLSLILAVAASRWLPAGRVSRRGAEMPLLTL